MTRAGADEGAAVVALDLDAAGPDGLPTEGLARAADAGDPADVVVAFGASASRRLAAEVARLLVFEPRSIRLKFRERDDGSGDLADVARDVSEAAHGARQGGAVLRVDLPLCLVPLAAGLRDGRDDPAPPPCPLASRCALADRCDGPSEARLRREPGLVALLRPSHVGRDDGPPAGPIEALAAALDLRPGARFDGFTAGRPFRRDDRLALRLRRGADAVEVFLEPRDDGRPAFARTATLNVVTGRAPEALMRAAAGALDGLMAHLRGVEGPALRWPARRAWAGSDDEVARARAMVERVADAAGGGARARLLEPLDALDDVARRAGGDARRELWTRVSVSARLTEGGCAGGRCGVSLALSRFDDPGAALAEVARRLRAPARVAENLRHLAGASTAPRRGGAPIFYVASEAGAAGRVTWRTYFQDPLRARDAWGEAPPAWADLAPPVDILGFEWDPAGDARPVPRWYLGVPGAPDVLDALGLLVRDPRARAAAREAYAASERLGIRHAYLRLDDRPGGKARLAMFLVLEPHPVALAREELASLARLVRADEAAFSEWLARVRPARVDCVAAGVDRDGRPYVTPYFLGAGGA